MNTLYEKVILSKKCPLSFGLGSPLLSMKLWFGFPVVVRVHSFCWGESVVGGLGVGKIVYKQIIFRSDSSLDCKKQKKELQNIINLSGFFVPKKTIIFQTNVFCNQLKMISNFLCLTKIDRNLFELPYVALICLIKRLFREHFI